MDCSRSITFTIPGTIAAPGVQVTVVEDEGALVFTLQVLPGADGLIGDLRGLFFDFNDDDKLIGLAYSGTSLITDFATGNVIDLGNGANMNGVASFDVGIELGTQGIGKDDIQTVTFTLSNASDNLTLDDIANTAFGVRMTGVGPTSGTRSGDAKLTTIAPAAPDAMDDSPGIFEDGQSGLGDPSLVPEGVLFQVLANDTDADGDTLTITDAFGASNGTVQVTTRTR